MAMDFMKLGAVGTVDKVLDTDTVLVERGGSIYRVAGNRFGGAGGFLLEVDADTATWDDGDFVITQDVTDMVAAYQAGSNVVVKMPISFLEPDVSGEYYLLLTSLADMGGLGAEYAGIYVGALFAGGGISVIFTNGNPYPASEASVTSLRMKKGASDGES